jgi:PhnB protein
MASDGMASGTPNFQGVSLSLTVDDVAKADQFFNALAEGGQVQLPLTQTFFAKRFGMVADKFGVAWMILGGLEHDKPA